MCGGEGGRVSLGLFLEAGNLIELSNYDGYPIQCIQILEGI